MVNMEIEMGVLEYLLDERAEGLTVTNKQLQAKALEIASTIRGMEEFKVSFISVWLVVNLMMGGYFSNLTNHFFFYSG